MINNGPSGEFEQEAEKNKDRHLSSDEIKEELAFLSAKQGR